MSAIRRRSSRRPPRDAFSWRALAFEVFAVVLGVTLALGAAELRQRAADERRVDIATQSLAAELRQNCKRLEQSRAYHEQILAGIDSVRVADPTALESFERMQRAISSWRGYNPAFVTASAYETALATGALELMPYERALGLGGYYTFVDLYQTTVQQAFAAVLQSGNPPVRQVETSLQLTFELERELGPQSCKGAQQLDAESTSAARDSTAAVP